MVINTDGEEFPINWVSKGTELDVVSAVAQIMNRPDDPQFYRTTSISIQRLAD